MDLYIFYGSSLKYEDLNGLHIPSLQKDSYTSNIITYVI
jgi:hypothetical protein